jgi:hypothetical protein
MTDYARLIESAIATRNWSLVRLLREWRAAQQARPRLPKKWAQ